MHFGLSDEQRLLDASLRRFLAERLPSARVRELAASERAHDPSLWRELAGLGVAGLLVAGDEGGSGLGMLEAALAAQALAHAAAPTPFLASAVMAPAALAAAGTPAQRRAWLPRLAAGEACVGVAASEAVARRDGAGVAWDGARLSGRALFALDSGAADAFLVAPDRARVALVARDAPGLEVVALATVDRTRRVAELVLDGVAPAEWLGGPEGGATAVTRMLAAGRVALAAELLGCAERALELSVAYAKQRVQFGRPIGSFQAVKHMCAEMAAELEPARSLVWWAAHAFDALPAEASMAAAHAKAHLAEVASAIVRSATEVHGGIGFTDEHDLQLWFKRVAANRHLLGSPDRLREEAARAQGW